MSDVNVIDKAVDKLSVSFKEILQDVYQEAASVVEEEYVPTIQNLKKEAELLGGSTSLFEEAETYLQRYAEAINKTRKETRKILNKTKISEDSFIFTGGLSAFNTEDHKFYIQAARDKVKWSPFLRNIKNKVREATLTGNIRIDIPHDVIDSLIGKILKKNKFKKKLKGWIEHKYVDSEVFIPMFISNKGEISFRSFDPVTITEIEYDPEDEETILAFKRVWTTPSNKIITKWYAYVDYFNNLKKGGSISEHDAELEKDILVFYFKCGYRAGKRGELPLLPVLRYDRVYEEILIDLARLYHERAKVVWIMRLLGNKQDIFSRTERPPKGGTIKIETDNKRWRIENSKLSEHTSREYGRPHRLAIAAGVGFPEYLVFSDSSNQSYATLRKSDSPFGLFVLALQDDWVDDVSEMVTVMIRELVARDIILSKVEIERLPVREALRIIMEIQNNEKGLFAVVEQAEKIEKELITIDAVDLPVTIIFPRFETDNRLVQAQTLNVLRQTSLISKRTAIKLLGLDPDNELALIKYELTTNNVKDQGGKKEQPNANYDRKLDRGTV